MGFSSDIKIRARIAAASCCCVCHKRKGSKIEIHHIIPEADGGPNTYENAIPLCFDCHCDAGHYNPRHPKGTKYSPKELILARDDWYLKVSENKIEGSYNSSNIIKEFIGGERNKENFVYTLHHILDLSVDLLSRYLHNSNITDYSWNNLDIIIRQLTNLPDSNIESLQSNKLTGGYENILLSTQPNMKNEYVKRNLESAGYCIKSFQFKEALPFFERALDKIDFNDGDYNTVYKEYLTIGYIHYSKMNDMVGMQGLEKLNKGKPDEKVDKLIADIFQEICGRDIDLKNLEKSVQIVENLYTKCSDGIKPSLSNTLGLAYRRLGERGDVSYLHKAIDTLNGGISLSVNKNPELDLNLRNNLAITHIRLFELNGERESLDKAENILMECKDRLDQIVDPREYALKPKILNNLGNVFKQKVLKYGDITSSSKAIYFYEAASQIWTESDACYEWAMLRKNIGETKLAHSQVTNDVDLILSGLVDCLASTKYRTIDHSPYQWTKSMNVVFSILTFLDESSSLHMLGEELKNDVNEQLFLLKDNKKISQMEEYQNLHKVATYFYEKLQ